MTTTVDSIIVAINVSATDGGVGGGEGLANPVWASVFIGLFCSLIVVGTVVGNILVCTAVSIVRKLRTPSNWLIVSLAVADLLVALLVMPLAIVYEVCIATRRLTLHGYCPRGSDGLFVLVRVFSRPYTG